MALEENYDDIPVLEDELTPEQIEELQELLQEQEAQRLEQLERFAESLKRTRVSAISARQNSGIEDEWDRAEDAYDGIDDANREMMASARTRKPLEMGRSSVARPSRGSGRSSILLNITRNYVDAASARVGDMMLPVDDQCWGLEPTPVPNLGESGGQAQAPEGLPPELMGAMEGATPPVEGATPPVEGATPPSQSVPDAEGMPPAPPEDEEFPETPIVKAARLAAEGATKQIADWLEETRWHSEMRRVFDNAALLGTGVLKGPVPVRRISRKVTTGEDGSSQLEYVEDIAPESRSISPRNCYPDPACGGDVQNGSFFWEYDRISAKQLRDMIGLPGYLDDQIEEALARGPGYSSDPEAGRKGCDDESMFDVWYYTGRAEREDLEAAGVDLEELDESEGLPCMITIVEDCVVQASLSPLDSGELPYDFMVWQRRPDMPWGKGVPIQMETSQRGLTAALRNLMDNAGVSAGAQIVVNRNAIDPADGTWDIGGGIKLWWLKDGADVSEVGKAFDLFKVPSVQPELQAIMDFFIQSAESETGITSMLQGQAQVAGPDTYSGQLLLMNNAGALLRRIARICDDKVTERHISRYYDWLLLYGEDDRIKGDFQVKARGSTAMVELALQNQFIFQMGQMVDNPAFGIDPEKWFNEMLKSQRLDPERFRMDDDKRRQMAEQQPPPPPQVMVAQIRAEAQAQIAQGEAQARMQIAEMQAQSKAQIAEMQEQNKAQIAELNAEVQRAVAQMREGASVEKMRLDTDRDAVALQATADRTRILAIGKQEELELRRQLAMLDYANREKITLDKIKSDLAKEAMKVQSVERLAAIGARAEHLPTPPIEPIGKAPPGKSWQK